MSKLIQYTWVEFKLLFRVPVSVFFTVLFPQVLLIVFAVIYENSIEYEGLQLVDVYLPSMILLSLFSSGITSFSIFVAHNRSQKLWQVYRLRGYKLYQIVTAQLFVEIVLSLISAILLIIVAHFALEAKMPSFDMLALFFANWFIIAISMYLIGFLIGVFSKNEKVAQAVSMPIMFGLMIVSGVMSDFNTLPTFWQNVLDYIPTTQANKILQDSWINVDSLQNNSNWMVIIVWIVISLALVLWKLYRDNFKRL